MKIFTIFLTILIVMTLLFLAFWIPSERAGLDKNANNIDLKRNWKKYLCAFIFTSFLLIAMHLLLDQRAYISPYDIPIYYVSLFAVSPIARRIYREMKNFILRR
jgi:hypothetical protein